ncbi:Transferrin domain containing protein [Trichuris trichiura]|uniref:Transferrin domain containing protein n=1 Tax=Trichuris trichiura TaxID=36087 RepID=A0A077ZBQ0_TRITR|nr:Transferrin domain containing protein [Trichuris trichiura]
MISILLALFAWSSMGPKCESIRWCVRDSGYNQQLCAQMQQDLQRRNTSTDFRCVYGLNQIDCMQQIRSGSADSMNLDAEEVYVAGRYLSLRVATYEKVEARDFVEESLVVIREASFKKYRVSDLANKRLCLPKVEEGNMQYQALISVLLPLGIIPTKEVDCRSPAQTLANYFGQSCMPGRWSKLPTDDSPGRQCALCPNACTHQGPYASAAGALRCLIERRADVAVTSANALSQYPTGRNGLSPSKYKLLCLQGSSAELDEGCSWFGRRGNAFVVSPLAKSKKIEQVRNTLNKIFRAFNGTKPAWFRRMVFSSSNVTTLGETNGRSFTYKRYLGSLFVRSMESPFASSNCLPSTVRFCLTAKQRKCQSIAMAWATIRLKPTLECQQAIYRSQCVNSLLHDRSDIALMSAPEAIESYIKHGLVPIAVEILENDVQASYLLAVLTKRRNLAPGQLYGAKACFGGGTTRTLTLILLERLRILRLNKCRFDQVHLDFFKPACKPAASEHYGLCALCDNAALGRLIWKHASGNRTSKEGADVAFLNLNYDQVMELQRASNLFMLMCPDGKRRRLDEFTSCTWLTTPGSAVVASKTASYAVRRRLTEMLVYAQRYYERKKPNDKFSMFASRMEQATLFDKRTVRLKPVWTSNDYGSVLRSTFGGEMIDIYERYVRCGCGALKATYAVVSLLCALAAAKFT